MSLPAPLPRYELAGVEDLLSPSMVVFVESVRHNIDRMIHIAGRPERLRPHCKTHKMAEITRLELARGITRHKAATIAEVEMLASAGAKDILLAYAPVGPNIARCVALRQRFPEVQLAVTADHLRPLAQLGAAMTAAGLTIDVLLDLNCGMNRTGIEPGPQAVEFYLQIARTPGIVPAGLHAYDGHNHQTDRLQRSAAVHAVWEQVFGVLQALHRHGVDVPRVVVAGTGSFPIWAEMDSPLIELSPGTTVLHDYGYATIFPDLYFEPAALMLTRVVSRPGHDRVTLDLGNKAVAADPPMGQRVYLPAYPEAELVAHNEEHLVIRTPRAGELQPGDALWAVPRHICPTSALHRWVYVAEAGKITGTWEVTARDRQLTL